MFPGIPLDIALFVLVVLGFFAIGLPLIAGRVWVPRRVEFEEVPEHELSPQQSSYFAALDAKLLDLGFRPVSTILPTNMQGKALIRLYLSEVDPAAIMMNLMTSEASGGQEHPMNYLEVMTRYEDGSILSTRNAEISDVLDRLPDHTVVERRGLRDPAALKRVHDEKAEEFKIRGAVYSRVEEFEPAFHQYHERWCDHQIAQGLLSPIPGGEERLRPTVKAGLRGIFNFLNPFADNFTVGRCILALVFGLVVPGAVVLWLGGPGSEVIQWISDASGLQGEHCLIACFVILFGLAGLVVGTLFVTKAFIWCFLLTYVLLRLVGPSGIWVTLAMSVWSGVAADWGARFKERRNRLA